MMPASVLVLTTLAAAPELSTMFPMQARVHVTEGSTPVVRLPLPQEVLERSQADMSDVRLFDDDSGRIVPFVVRRHEEALELANRVRLKMVSVERKVREQTKGPPLYHEQAVFELPAEAEGIATVTLSTLRADFVRLATFELLTSTGAVLSTTQQPLFRLAEANAERLDVTLPRLTRGAQRLRVSFEGEAGGFLEAAADLRWSTTVPESGTLRWPIAAAPQSVGKTTRLVMGRPSGFVPTRLEVETSTPWFLRRVTVKGEGSVIASGMVARKPGSPAVEVLSVPMPRATAELLEVVIDNQDSAPLEQLKLSWVIEQPELVFAPTSKNLSLLFGGARTQVARYDIDGLGLGRAELADSASLAPLETPRPNPSYVPASVLGAFRNPGVPFETKRSPFQAKVARWTAGEEVVTVQLGPKHAETMSADFADLRLLDGQGRQWPYLLETTRATTVMGLRGPSTSEGLARYECEPRGRLVALTVRPAAGTGYFSRRARFAVIEADKVARTVWEGTLTFNPSERGESTSLRAVLGDVPLRQGTLELSLNQGGDGVLEGLQLEVELLVPTLKTIAPPGDYRVVWGEREAGRPNYDLARARSVVDELKWVSLQAQEPEANPDYQPPSLLERTGGANRWLFWGALTLAVGVLATLALKMARSE